MMGRKNKFPLFFLLATVLLSAIAGGCNQNGTMIKIKGSVSDHMHPNAPIVIGIWPAEVTPATGTFPLLYKELEGPGQFTWVIWEKLQGDFAVAAFEDFNRNLFPDKDETLSYASVTPIHIEGTNPEFNLRIIISKATVTWNQAGEPLLNKFFSYLNDKDLNIVNLFHPIRYFDQFYYDYDRIKEKIVGYFYPPTSETYLNHAYKLDSISGPGTLGIASLQWIMDLPKTSLVASDILYADFILYMDKQKAYIKAININSENRGIKFLTPPTAVDKNTLIEFNWTDESNLFANPTYDIEVRVFSTPASCVTELYSQAVTPFTWSKPFKFFYSSGTLSYPNSSIQPPYPLYDKIANNAPLKFEAYDGSRKDFHFNPYCLYMVKVWIHSDDPQYNEKYRTEGPYGILYLNGSKR